MVTQSGRRDAIRSTQDTKASRITLDGTSGVRQLAQSGDVGRVCRHGYHGYPRALADAFSGIVFGR